jgi:hypothetical protein
MKPIQSLILAVLAIPSLSSMALANDSLGTVIRDSIRSEIRDDIRDNVRNNVCDRRAQQDRNPDLCNTLNDVDALRDDLRRGVNRIRAIDAILD